MEPSIADLFLLNLTCLTERKRKRWLTFLSTILVVDLLMCFRVEMRGTTGQNIGEIQDSLENIGYTKVFFLDICEVSSNFRIF